MERGERQRRVGRPAWDDYDEGEGEIVPGMRNNGSQLGRPYGRPLGPKGPTQGVLGSQCLFSLDPHHQSSYNSLTSH